MRSRRLRVERISACHHHHHYSFRSTFAIPNTHRTPFVNMLPDFHHRQHQYQQASNICGPKPSFYLWNGEITNTKKNNKRNKKQDRRTKDTGAVFAHDFINDTVSMDQSFSDLHSFPSLFTRFVFNIDFRSARGFVSRKVCPLFISTSLLTARFSGHHFPIFIGTKLLNPRGTGDTEGGLACFQLVKQCRCTARFVHGLMRFN